MSNDKRWYKNLTTEEVIVAKGYHQDILDLLKELPKDASEEEQIASHKKQKAILDNKIAPLISLSISREKGISLNTIEELEDQQSKSSSNKIIPLILFVIVSVYILVKYT